MRLFSEEVKSTSSNSPLNILQVKDFSEVFFGVFEVQINEKKYPVEEIGKHGGNPVVMLPILIEGVEREYPFILLKGKQEIFFNENNTEIPTTDVEIMEESVEEINNEQILIDIEKLKKESIRKAQEELIRNTEILKERAKKERLKKEKALREYLESARENLVNEFTNISNKIRKELISDNDYKFEEIRESVDLKIQDIADNLKESLENNFENSSKLIDKSVKKLVKELYESNINPKVDKELKSIAEEIVEKVSEIDKNLNNKLDKKADVSLIESVGKEIDAIRDANIELNNSLNKGVQKALSRVGNVDRKIDTISEQFDEKITQTEKEINTISEEFDKKLSETEQEITQYFDEKLSLVKEETLDITDEARNYFKNMIQESKDNLLSEIRKIKNEQPVEYILESKKGEPIVKDWDSIEKEWNKKIHDKFENYKTDLRKYVAVYASGGGTNATQYQDGGTMNGDLTIIGKLSANEYLGISIPSGEYLPLSGGTVTGDVSVTGLLSANRIGFNTGAGLTAGVGQLAWNDTDGTLELGLKGGAVKTELGQGLVTRVVNKTTPSVDLLGANYQVVVISGAQGQRLSVRLAQADNDANSAGTLGIVAEDIPKNQEGFVVTVGLLKNRNTTGSLQGETWNDGDILYLSPTVAGRITNIKPQAPQHTVIVGYVEYAHVNNGKIYVKIDNGYEIDELHNVKITNVSGNDVLKYNGTAGVWENSNTLSLSSLSANSMFVGGLPVATRVDPVRTTLTGNGVLSSFAINGAANLINPSALIVAIDGVLQEPVVDYTVNNGTITFTDPLASGAKAVVISPSNALVAGQVVPSDGSVTSAKIATGVTLTAPSLVGPVDISNQDASNPNRVMNRDLVDFRFFEQMENMWISPHGAILATNTGSATTDNQAGISLFTGSTPNSVSLARIHGGSSTSTPMYQINWSRPVVIAGFISSWQVSPNGISRLLLGVPQASTTPVDLTNKGVGIRCVGDSINLVVHNGSNLTTIPTGRTLLNQGIQYFRIVCNGNGNVEFYLNKILVASTSLGPTGNPVDVGFTASATNSTDAAPHRFIPGLLKIWTF